MLKVNNAGSSSGDHDQFVLLAEWISGLSRMEMLFLVSSFPIVQSLFLAMCSKMIYRQSGIQARLGISIFPREINLKVLPVLVAMSSKAAIVARAIAISTH
jgi:hypothetical protein